MKTGRWFLTGMLALLFGAQLTADDGVAVRAKTITHPDGSYTEEVMSPREKTTRATTYDQAGKVKGKVLHRLNADMLPVTTFVYDAAGRPIYRTDIKRDYNGRIVETEDSTPGNKTIRRLVYEYDSLGKLSAVKTYNPEGKLVATSKVRKQ